jgi:hypothetical protein
MMVILVYPAASLVRSCSRPNGPNRIIRDSLRPFNNRAAYCVKKVFVLSLKLKCLYR